MRSRFKHAARRRSVGRKAWYLAPTALNGAISLGAIPLLIAAVGTERWASIALGQTVGLIASVIVSMGWPIAGPALIASSTRLGQERALKASIGGRLLVALPVLMTLGCFAILFPHVWDPLVASTAIATSLVGVTSAWYFLGLDRPMALFLSDSLARSVGMLAGLLATFLTGNAFFFAIGILSGNCSAAAIPLFYARARSRWKRIAKRKNRKLDLFEKSSRGAAANFLFVLLSSLAMPATTILSPEIFIAFALYDKLQKQFTSLLLPIAQIIVARLSKAHSPDGLTSIVSSSQKRIVLSGAGATVVCAIGAPMATDVISLGTVSMDLLASIIFSVLVGLTFVAQALPVAVLAPLQGLHHAVLGNATGSIFIVPLVIVGGAVLGVHGVLLASLIVFGVVVVVLQRGVKKSVDARPPMTNR